MAAARRYKKEQEWAQNVICQRVPFDWSVATLFFLSPTMKAVIVRLLCCPLSMDGRVGRTEQEYCVAPRERSLGRSTTKREHSVRGEHTSGGYVDEQGSDEW